MKHLKRFNESQDSYTKEELKELISISLEDNNYFNVVDLFITDAVANKHDTRMMLRIDESFSDNVELDDLGKQVIDKSNEYVDMRNHFARSDGHMGHKPTKEQLRKAIMAEYLELEEKLTKEILEINKKVLDKLCKKYDLEIQTLELDLFNDEGTTHRIKAVIYHTPGLYN